MIHEEIDLDGPIALAFKPNPPRPQSIPGEFVPPIEPPVFKREALRGEDIPRRNHYRHHDAHENKHLAEAIFGQAQIGERFRADNTSDQEQVADAQRDHHVLGVNQQLLHVCQPRIVYLLAWRAAIQRRPYPVEHHRHRKHCHDQQDE